MGDLAHLLKVLDRDNIRLPIPGPSIWLPTLCLPRQCLGQLLMFKHRS